MADNHPIRSTAAAENGVVEDTLLEAMVKRLAIVVGVTETLDDFNFETGEVPLAVIWAKTGFVYFYDSTDTTTPGDGLTTIVTGDGKRYHIEDSASVSLNTILSVETSPPGSPTVGDVHRVGTSATGDFAGHDDKLAVYTKRGWVFGTPQIGHTVLNQDTGANEQYTDSGWDSFLVALGDGQVYPAKLLFPLGVSVEAQQNAPPGSPSDGQAYLVGTSGSGDWSGQSNKVAVRVAGAWGYIAPYGGAKVYDKTSKSDLQYDAAGGTWSTAAAGGAAVCEGRLTLESGVAVSTSDQTAKATLYLTPWRGNRISVFTGGQWSVRTFTERSLSLSGLTSGKPYDVFIYDNAGTLTLEALVWTNDTTRATALALQDGILVKSGDATRRYLGTFYTTATGQTEDSYAKRMVWNYYNRVIRPMRRFDTTDSWTYNSATMRAANNSSANRLDFVQGVAEDGVEAFLHASANNGGTSQSVRIGIGLDSTTTVDGGGTFYEHSLGISGEGRFYSEWRGIPGVGRHYLSWNEASLGGNNCTYYGDKGGERRSGIVGSVMG